MKKKAAKPKNKTKKEEMSTDDFLAGGLDQDSDDSELENDKKEQEQQSDEEEMEMESPSKHKKTLEKLKKSDPEFYAYLAKEDQELLNFDSSDDDSEEEETKGKKFHKLPKKLQVASDEEDDSEDEEEAEEEEEDEEEKPTKKKSKKGKSVLKMKMVERWSQLLREKHSVEGLKEAVEAFRAVVYRDSDEDVPLQYKVDSTQVFNAVVRLCMVDMPMMLNTYLKVANSKDSDNIVHPSKCPGWSKVKQPVKMYLEDLLQMMKDLNEPAILNVTLKHISQMIPYVICFPKVYKLMLKKMISVWSSGEETCRVLAFISIMKMARGTQMKNMDTFIKKMYIEYVKNCKFTSPTTLPQINFMQRSLVEILALDLFLTYQHAFVYIRQLAIHLRNAMTTKKKETCQAVYNWQYIHSLGLWARMLSTLHPSEMLQPLIYPLTQTIIGTIKLIPTARYYPLRFHCVRLLNMISASTNTFIPTLPFILEVFELTDFNKKHKHISFKPIDFSCILKLSKKQLEEKTFRDSTIDQMYEHLMESLHYNAHTVSFPELTLPLVLQLKQFLKTCKVANYTKQMKQILDRVQENAKVITLRRKSVSLDLTDTRAMNAWEQRSKEEGTPIGKYYSSWRKLRDRELIHEMAGKERISEDGMPRIERNRAPRQATEDDRKEFAELFESGSEDEDDETRFLMKDERPAKKKKTEEENDSDDYSDLDEEDLEMLNRSASEDEDEDEDEGDDDDDDEAGEEDDDAEDGDADDDMEEEGKEEEEESSDGAEDEEDIVKDFEMSDLDSD